jgi:alcohol dehydrogenase (cytochrome c)
VFSIFYLTATGKPEGWAGRDTDLWSNSTIRAIDYRTGKIAWNHEIGEGESGAGIMTTAGHLLFTADNEGNILALDPATGKTLWHLSAGGRVENSPMTYELDERQYVVMAVQDELYAFALPENLVHTATTAFEKGNDSFPEKCHGGACRMATRFVTDHSR